MTLQSGMVTSNLDEGVTQSNKSRRFRILQVVARLDRAGAEIWLLSVLRHLDRKRFDMDFLVATEEECELDAEVRSLGSKVLACPSQRRPWRYGACLERHLRDSGPYDVIHSHVEDYGGFVLKIAAQCGVPVRIAHSHNDWNLHLAHPLSPRALFLKLGRKWISRYATLGLAASRRAAADRFGSNWSADPRWKPFYCSIDCTPYRVPVDSGAVRRELGIPPGAIVIGNVARICAQKNHIFFVDVAGELARRIPEAFFLLVGNGDLRSAVEEKVATLGLSKNFLFTGVRADVPRIFLGAMDVMLFPSLYEGLGLVLVEAQAAGVPCVISDRLPEEVNLSPLIRRVSLNEAPSKWADAVIESIHCERSIKERGLELVEKSVFNIENSIRQLEEIYSSSNSPKPLSTLCAE